MKYEIDAENQTLGRVSTKIATILRGKHLASYQPHILPDIDVVVKNVNKIRFTGAKLEQKIYFHYSGFPGGMKERKLETEWAKKPNEVLRRAVYRMLPKNRIRDRIITRLQFQ